MGTSGNRPQIRFSCSNPVGNEMIYLAQALEGGSTSGGGEFSVLCERWLAQITGTEHVHLVQSATVGLELAILSGGIGPGDEVILPSFTFVSCANAIALRGAIPVFAEIDSRTLNLDPAAVEAAITERTRAILCVHYAGVPCEMDAIRQLADRHGLLVIEDAAQALLSTYRGQPAGSLGDIGVFSFHDTKNVSCGEGGAVVVNTPSLINRAEVAHQKGTDRAAFDRGMIAQYTWADLGSSYVPSEITAAVLFAQFEKAHAIMECRRTIWEKYYDAFAPLEAAGRLRRPVVPAHVAHNGHLFYLLLEDKKDRDTFIERMGKKGITTPFHYVPLHNAPGGRIYGRATGNLHVSESIPSRLVRMPLWPGVSSLQNQVIDAAIDALR